MWLAGVSFILLTIMIKSNWSVSWTYITLHVPSLHWLHVCYYINVKSDRTAYLEIKSYSKCEQGHSNHLDGYAFSCWQMTTHTHGHTHPSSTSFPRLMLSCPEVLLSLPVLILFHYTQPEQTSLCQTKSDWAKSNRAEWRHFRLCFS